MARLMQLFEGGNAGDAWADAFKARRDREKQGKLAQLVSQAYAAQDDGQRRGLLQQAMAQDPTMGMNAAKVLDPRFRADQMPSGIREFEALTKGMSPEDQARARRIAAGLDPRAVTGAMKFGTFEDSMGRPRPQRNNPTTGQSEIYQDETGSWVPLGGGQMPQGATPPMNPQQPPAMPPQQGASAGLNQPGYGGAQPGSFDPQNFYAGVGGAIDPHGGRITSTNGGQHNPGSNHYNGGAVDVGMGRETPEQQQAILQALKQQGYNVRDERTKPPGQQVWRGPHLHVEPGQQQRPQPTGGLGVGMGVADKAYTAEDAKTRAQINNADAVGRWDAQNAARKEAATQGVQIGNMPTIGGIEAQNAGLKENATIRARMEAERGGKMANARLDATETVNLIGGAEKLLEKASGGAMEAGRDRLLGAFNQTTEGSRATAGLKIIASKLIQKVPRFEGPQSNIDVQSYREAAGDVANDMLPVGQRLAALQTMKQLALKAQQQGGQGGQRPAATDPRRQSLLDKY